MTYTLAYDSCLATHTQIQLKLPSLRLSEVTKQPVSTKMTHTTQVVSISESKSNLPTNIFQYYTNPTTCIPMYKSFPLVISCLETKTPGNFTRARNLGCFRYSAAIVACYEYGPSMIYLESFLSMGPSYL